MVATTNANESRTGNQMNRDLKSQKNSRGGAVNNPRGNKYNFKDSNSQHRNNDFKSNNTSRYNNFKPNDRSSYSFPKNYDKDEEPENRGAKGHKTADRAKNYQSKEKEQQPDKLETLRRLEREKKAIQKKNRNSEEHEKLKRPQMKSKKSSKKDWTKNYLSGMFDEDDDYDPR